LSDSVFEMQQSDRFMVYNTTLLLLVKTRFNN